MNTNVPVAVPTPALRPVVSVCPKPIPLELINLSPTVILPVTFPTKPEALKVPTPTPPAVIVVWFVPKTIPLSASEPYIAALDAVPTIPETP